MKKLLAIATVLALTACASPEEIAARKAAFQAARDDQEAQQRGAAVITCNTKAQCDKIFRIASDAVTEMADMKVQTASTNYIATYNPTEYGYIGMAARRVLVSGDAEKITLDVVCKGMYGDMPWESCYSRVASIYRAYKSRLAN